MQYLILFVAIAFTSALGASLPDTPERKDNVIVLEAAAAKVPEDDRRPPDDEGGEPFEIVVPIARNFSSLEELFQILREDDPKEPRVATGTPPSYVKGTERNATDYLIFFADSVGKRKGST